MIDALVFRHTRSLYSHRVVRK